MSKRSAQGPQGSKDDEHLFEMSSTPNDAPQRATAAQLASRKIKDIRRRPRGTTPTGPASDQPSNVFGAGTDQPSNAFGGLSAPNFSSPSASFGAPAAQAGAQSGGFSFGQTQSQSFPGASSVPNQPSQTSSAPFSFGGGGQTSFNFGGSSGGFGSSTFNNPFAGDSGNSAPAPATQGTSFSGFGFGNQTTSQPAPPSQPAFSFGAPQNASASPGPGLFGQSNVLNSGSTPADSMQTSPDTKPKAPTTTPSSFQNRNLFGDSASSMFSPKPATPASNPFTNLNVPSTAEKPASDKAEGFAAKPAFASQSTSSSNQTPQFGNLFGTPSTTAKPSEPEKPTSTNMFGSGSSQSAFTGLSAPKPTDEQAPQNNVFAPKSTSEQTTDKPADANPFKNLFGAAPATPQTSTSSQPQASTAQNLFTPKPTGDQASNKPTESQPFKNLFGGAAPSNTPKPSEPEQAVSTLSAPTNLFSPKPALDQSADKPADATPFKNLFGATAGTPKPSEPAKGQETPAQNLFSPKPTTNQPTSNNLFASKPIAEQSSEKPANSNPFGALFGASPSTPQSSEPAKPQATPAPNLFASSQPPASQPKPFGDHLGAKPAVLSQSSTSPAPMSLAPSSANAKSAAAPQIPKPNFADNVDKSNPELMKNIRALDAIFKEELSTYQPGVDGFDSLIIHYMGVRQAMGAPIGFKNDWKTAAAMPITNGQVAKNSATMNGLDDNDSATSSVFAQSFSSPTKSTQPAANAASSPLKNNSISGPSSAPKVSENPFAMLNAGTTGPVSKPAENPFAKTTATSAASESAPKTAENPFAKIPTTTQGPASSAPATTTSLFGSSQSTAAKDSETPAAPKLTSNMFANPQSSSAQGSAAPLSMPKFGNGTGGVDFFAQFQKKAQDDEAKAKAKRKAEDFDSDEDDEEEWERRDAEQQREKRAKLEAASKKKAVFVPGKGFQFVDADEKSKDDSKKLALPAPSPAPSSTGSIFDSSNQPVPTSQNIFGRLSSTTPQPADNDNDSDASDEPKIRSPKRAYGDGADDEDGSEASGHNTKRPGATENGEKTKSSLDTPIPAPTAAAGRSLFDRIESPAPGFASPKPSSGGINFGASSNSGNPFAASLGAKSQTSQLFGASFNPGSSQPASTSSPAPADNTWKPTTPIKFASDANSASAQASTEASAQTSGAENATSGAATPDEDGAPGSIFDMSSANSGEEEETLVFECRARAFKLTTGWVSQGTGVVRLLKHPGTDRARIVLRADPGGNIILNALLKKELDYARTSNSVQFMVPQVDGKPEQWAIRVKAESIEAFHEKIQAIKN